MNAKLLIIWLIQDLTRYFEFYNNGHLHRRFGYQTSAAIYQGVPVIPRTPKLS